MNFLQEAENLFVCWDTRGDASVFFDTFGVSYIYWESERHWVTSEAVGNDKCRLKDQVQTLDLQPVVGATPIVKVAGYDANQQIDPLNVPAQIALETAANTMSHLAVMPRICAASLQEVIYGEESGYTDPKLFRYHDEAKDLPYLIHAPTGADEARAKLTKRGLKDWIKTPRSATLMPNRQCFEAIGK